MVEFLNSPKIISGTWLKVILVRALMPEGDLDRGKYEAIWYKVNPKSPSRSQISPRADLSGAGLIWIQITHLLIFTVFALLLLSRFCPMTPPLPTILEILVSEHKQAIFGTPCTGKFFMSAFFWGHPVSEASASSIRARN